MFILNYHPPTLSITYLFFLNVELKTVKYSPPTLEFSQIVNVTEKHNNTPSLKYILSPTLLPSTCYYYSCTLRPAK